MTTEHDNRQPLNQLSQGAAAYDQWRERFLADPAQRAIYDDVAAKMDLWLHLVEARQEAGLTQAELARRLGVSQAQVARVEKCAYDAYTLTSLRRYVAALGEGYSLQVAIRTPSRNARAHTTPA